ncbi:uncharacterized protein LOC117320755 isoform X2 [Pecten maximus]|uniref:uncharacterized protein LOC117320755 isoform X2 n=1 Tax=Pecten maximus TaxID=6579 RepID=UPI001457F2E7|nr:uncharacterized protein LOC117320755 isoform X2 [Pecten maximus]
MLKILNHENSRGGSNLTKAQSMENIDISSKYPRLQNSNFYQNLHKKYPQAFQRRLSSEAKTRRPRRLFNSGLYVRSQDDTYDSDDTRSVCSERPISSFEHDLREFLSYGDPQYDRDCRTSPTPSMMSDLTVKERLNATSDRLYHLLYSGVPQGRYKNSYDPGLTPRSEVTPRARRSRTSSVSSDLHGFDDLDNLSSPRHLDPYHNILDTNSLSHEEHIHSLQRQLEHKDRQLRTYRQKLDLDAAGRFSNSFKHSEDLDSSYTRVISPDSPPDSAIDVDSSSVQSVISMDTRYHHNTDNSSTDVKYSPDTLQRNGYLPNSDANYFVNDLDSFTLTDVIQEVDEENLATDVSGTVASNSSGTSVATNKAHEEGLSGTDDREQDGGSTDKVSQAPNTSPLESEAETMMHEIVQHTLSRIPSNGLLNRTDSSNGKDLQKIPVNDHLNSPGNRVTSTPGNDLHTSPCSDLPCSSGKDIHSTPGSDFHNTPGKDLHSSPDNNCVKTDFQKQNISHVYVDEEVDDSDPRLGIPEVKSCNETLIQERYHKKCQKIRYHTKRRCITPREKTDGAAVYRVRSQSDDPVSVLCSPRSPSSSVASNDKLQKSKLHQSNQSLNVITEKPDLRSRRLVSESDIRNVGLENTGIFFSKSSNTGSLGSFESSLSTDTLVASQQTLTEEDLTESYPKISLHSHSPRKKIRFKNIFKGKKGHYNPSQVEANLPVDLEAMLKRSSVSDLSHNQEVNQNFYSVQYEKSKHYSHHAELGESDDYVGIESPPFVNKLQGAKELTDVKENLSEVKDCHAAEHCSTVNGTNECLDVSAELRPPPAYSTHLEDSQLTAYEAALVNLDQNGLDIDELIDSDSDSVYSAKPVVIDSKQKKQNRSHETQETSDGGEADRTQVGLQSRDMVEKEGDDTLDSEDEVFTLDNTETTEKTLDNQAYPHLNREETELGKQVYIDRTKEDTDEDSQTDTLSQRSIPGVISCGKMDVVPAISGQDQGSEQEYQGSEQGYQGLEQGDPGSEQGDQGSERGDQGDPGSVPGIDTDDKDSAPVEGPYATVIVHSDTGVTQGAQFNSDSNAYSEVEHADKIQESDGIKGGKQMKQFSFTAAGGHVDDSITVLDQNTSHVPKRDYQREESNLVRSKELSASKQSLSDKVRSSAKSKFKAIRKAVSLDKGLNKAGTDNSGDTTKEKTKEKKKSGFKMPKIKNPLHFGKKKSKLPIPPVSNIGKNDSADTETPAENNKNDEDQKDDGKRRGPVWNVSSCQSLESLDNTVDPGLVGNNGPHGKLLKLNQDGTQVIQVHKPKHGPVGFFIARGNAQFNHGVFVSRFTDTPQEAVYSGLLCVGDEILEMNKFVLRDLALDDIYDIMAAKETLVMTVLPLMARKDV